MFYITAGAGVTTHRYEFRLNVGFSTCKLMNEKILKISISIGRFIHLIWFSKHQWSSKSHWEVFGIMAVKMSFFTLAVFITSR